MRGWNLSNVRRLHASSLRARQRLCEGPRGRYHCSSGTDRDQPMLAATRKPEEPKNKRSCNKWTVVLEFRSWWCVGCDGRRSANIVYARESAHIAAVRRVPPCLKEKRRGTRQLLLGKDSSGLCNGGKEMRRRRRNSVSRRRQTESVPSEERSRRNRHRALHSLARNSTALARLTCGLVANRSPLHLITPA